MQEKLNSIGFETVRQTSAESANYFKIELARWDNVVRAIGFLMN